MQEESLNEGMEIKDSTFAMAVNFIPRFNDTGGGFNNYNPSHNNKGRRRGNNARGRGRGPSSSQFNHFSPQPQGSNARADRPICQICGKASHLAIDCYHMMDYAYQGMHPPTKLATMVTSSNNLMTQEQPWLADSAATNHVTSSLNHLSFPKPYTGQEHLTVGNGQNLPITHIGNSLIPSFTFAIQLRNVLRVPSIASNLTLVHKICHDNNCSCYFDANNLLIQALAMGKVLYKGKREGGVYPIYPHKAPKLLLPHKLCNLVKLSTSSWQLWHSRLGYSNSQILRHVLQNNGMSSNNSVNLANSYIHCLHGKIHRLPFPSSRFVANSPFELVHTDLLGPAPFDSVNGYKYYVVFVDHFTCFTWLYLLTNK